MERAGVALVAVTNDVLLALGLCVGKLPFFTRGETAAAPSAKSRIEHFLNHVRSIHLQRARKPLKRACTEAFVDVFGVDAAAAVERHANLLFIEIDVFLFGHLFRRGRVYVQKSFNDFAADNILFDNFGNVFYLHEAVQGVFGINFHERSLRTEPKATYLIYGHFIAKPFFGNELMKQRGNFIRSGRKTARTAAKYDMSFAVLAREFRVQTRGAFCMHLIEFVKILNH